MKCTLKAVVSVGLVFVALLAAGCKKEKKAEVETSQITNVTSSSATAGGIVTIEGSSAVVDRGICWGRRPDPTVGISAAGSGVGAFSCDITGLDAGTTYYVRAYAINGAGVSYGSSVCFETLADNGGNTNSDDDDNNNDNDNPSALPVVVTSVVANITSTTAQCGGAVASVGTNYVTDRGFCWSKHSQPTVSNSYVSCGSGDGSFVVDMTDLETETTYYVRAYAMSAMGIAYGNEVSFVTAPQTNGPTNATSSTVTVSYDQWQWVNGCQWMVEIYFPAITEDVYDHGAVLVYMKVDNAWSQVPLTYYYQYDDPQAGIINCQASIEVATLNDQGIRIFWTQSDFYDGNDVAPVNSHSSFDFKIVVIEADIYQHHSDVDFSDYNAVKAAFHLTD